MINTSFQTSGIQQFRPTAASAGSSQETPAADPSESVQISSTPSKRSWLGSGLAKTATALGLTAALFCAAAPAANAQQVYYPQPVYCGQVQTGQQSGITIGPGGIGVYTTQQSVNTCNGTVTQTTVGINGNGVGIQQQVGVPTPYGTVIMNGPGVVFGNGHGHRHHGHDNGHWHNGHWHNNHHGHHYGGHWQR